MSTCTSSETTTLIIDDDLVIPRNADVAVSSTAKLTKDFTLSGERDASHYLAITLWLGWMQFYPAFMIAVPLLYKYEYHKLIALATGAILLSALTSISPESQPAQAYELGNWVVKKSAAYLGLRVYHENAAAINKEGKCIFLIEPHDVLPVGIAGFHREVSGLNKDITGCLSSACFSVPLMRHMYTWLKCGNVSKKSLVKALDAGKSVVICPGGAQEVAYMESDDEIILFIKSRFGLVKLALQSGTPIIPSFCFGQRKTYSFWVPRHEGMQRLCRKFGFIPVVFFGYFGIPLAPPKPAELALVCGAPIQVPKIDNPTKEDLQKFQTILITEMERIFEENKALHGMGDCCLKII
jgi:2-acylglycerol O-acyltransferase 2